MTSRRTALGRIAQGAGCGRVHGEVVRERIGHDVVSEVAADCGLGEHVSEQVEELSLRMTHIPTAMQECSQLLGGRSISAHIQSGFPLEDPYYWARPKIVLYVGGPRWCTHFDREADRRHDGTRGREAQAWDGVSRLAVFGSAMSSDFDAERSDVDRST